MKKLLKFGLICTIASSALMLASCAGEDGDPGVAGPQGEKGDSGDTGADGENGAGYDESAQFGNIAVTFKGTRPDDVPFEKAIDFKFAPIGPDAIYYSQTSPFNNDGSTGNYFYAQRYSSAVIVDYPNNGGNNYIEFEFNKYDNEESGIYFYAFVGITTDDLKFFRLSYRYNTPFEESVTDYSFTSATGVLKFKYHAVLPAENSDTGHDLDITADVNVNVFEYTGSPE